MINVLAVDDEKEILKIMKKALEKEGYVVTTVSEPETVKKMNLGCFQMILLDVMMPGTDGFSLCREIRDKVDCPILFVTAKTGEKELMTGLGIGGGGYIKKTLCIRGGRARAGGPL